MRVFVCFLMLAAVAMTAAAADVTGKWSGTFTPAGGDESSAYVILKQSGTTVTGSGGPSEGEQWPLTNGKIVGNKLTGEVKNPDGVVYKLSLVIEGDKLKGEVDGVTGSGAPMKATLAVTRVK
jgi:hypothetical protein